MTIIKIQRLSDMHGESPAKNLCVAIEKEEKRKHADSGFSRFVKSQGIPRRVLFFICIES